MKKIIALAIIIVCALMVVPDCHAQRKKKDYPLSLKDLFDTPSFGYNSPVARFKRLSKQQKADNINAMIDEIEERYHNVTSIDDLYDLDAYMTLIAHTIVTLDLPHSRELCLKCKHLWNRIKESIEDFESSSEVEATE